MGYRKIFLIGIILFTISSNTVPSWPHPHVFVDSTVTIVFDEKGIAGFEIRWAFDEMFSSMIILDFDTNGNSRFESSEVENVKSDAFSNLRKFDYFTHIKINGTPFKVKYVTDFSAKIIDGTLVYRFFIPCHIQAAEIFREVAVSIYDHTFYSSVFLAENPVTYRNRKFYDIEYRIEKNTDEAYYYGQVYPDTITLRFKRKNG